MVPLPIDLLPLILRIPSQVVSEPLALAVLMPLTDSQVVLLSILVVPLSVHPFIGVLSI